MNLFGIGPLEAVVIAVLALIFIGPERLPGVIRQLLTAYRQVRSLGTEWREQVEREIGGDLRSLTGDINSGLEAFGRSVEQEINAVEGEIREAQQEIVGAANQKPETLPLLPPASPTPTDDDDERPRGLDYLPS